MDKQYAVVTRVTPVRLGGRIMVHAYGPYTKNEAASISRELKRDLIREGLAHRSEVSICTLMNSLAVPS